MESFDYVAPDGPTTARSSPAVKNKVAHTTSVEVVGSPSEHSKSSSTGSTNSMTVEAVGSPASEHIAVRQKNSTDEEKVLIKSKVGSALTPVVPILEGQFVEVKGNELKPAVAGFEGEPRLERSNTPYATKVVVTADINT